MKILRNGKSVEKVEPPVVDICADRPLTELLRAWADCVRIPSGDFVNEDLRRAADEIDRLTSDRDRHREFVRSARGIVQEYASRHPRHTWAGAVIDPLGAHAWLSAEAREVGTMRDGGDPTVERT